MALHSGRIMLWFPLLLMCVTIFYLGRQIVRNKGTTKTVPRVQNWPRRSNDDDAVIDTDPDEPDWTKHDNVTGFPYLVVPNLVHFIVMGKKTLDFVEMVNIKAAYLHQKPDTLYIHCDCDALEGKYWEMVRDIPVLKVVYIERPLEIFGKKLGSVYHASDIARIKALMQYGGIFLDGDSYMVQSLDPFRKFEFSIGRHPDQYMGTQILVAHKQARFLKLWLETYHDYQADKWYYNAGELPTTSVLDKQPYLVHRVYYKFGVHMLVHNLYKTYWPEWKDYYALHLLARHRGYLDKESPIKEFDMNNIKKYNYTYGAMARLVLFGSTDML